MLACLCFDLLVDKVLNQNPKKPILFCFLYEIELACSCGSLGTISSTNIFGVVTGDENQNYFPQEEPQ